MKHIAVLLVVLLLSACATSSPNAVVTSSGIHLYRTIDREAGVVCWTWNGPVGGISCLPLKNTLLDEGTQ